MKFIDEYREPLAVRKLADEINRQVTRPWTIMEICGGQTHSIARFGIDELLPEEITLAHGPGCPVCVTPIELIDKAVAIARRQDTVFCSFGDMLRVPGSEGDLFSAKSEGGDVRIVYSPTDALKIARENPEKRVVFFAVGFETTAPANAMAVYQASKQGIDNFFLLVSHVLVPPAIEALLSSPDNRVQAFLAAGHVCAIMGHEQYKPLATKFEVPIVVTGFEPLDILEGVLLCVKQLEQGLCEVQNQYLRTVNQSGNQTAQQLISEVFQITPRKWRGIGEIPQSGLSLKDNYKKFDAEKEFDIEAIKANESELCISGLILRGAKTPDQCSAFGKECTPEHPLGAPMVSSEGACAAYYKYRKLVS